MQMTVSQRLDSMITRYEDWVLNGVPEGVDFRTTLSSAYNWSCPEYGIFAVRSKRDWNTKSEVYGKKVARIGSLLRKLRSVREVDGETRSAGSNSSPARKLRPYRTERTRRLAAEDEAEMLRGMLTSAGTQFHILSQRLEKLERDLVAEKVRREGLERRKKALDAENARLKRMLDPKSRSPRLVD